MKNNKIAVTYERVRNGIYETGIKYLTQKEYNKLLKQKEIKK